MTAYAILAAIAAVLGAFLGLRRKAARERDARVQAELDRDVARGRADVAEATVIVAEQVAERQADAEAKGDAAAIDPAVVAATTPAELIAAADAVLVRSHPDPVERRHTERVRAPLTKPRRRAGK